MQRLKILQKKNKAVERNCIMHLTFKETKEKVYAAQRVFKLMFKLCWQDV